MDEIQERVEALSTLVHELLKGAEDADGNERPPETVRVVLDIPKAWIVLAAWLMLTERARRSGEFKVAPIPPVELGRLKKITRPWAKQWLSRIIDSAMHDDLHELSIREHYFLSPPKSQEDGEAKRGDLDDGIPF